LLWHVVANVLLIARRALRLAMCCLVLETKAGVSGSRVDKTALRGASICDFHRI
jgi:hypothetical protein